MSYHIECDADDGFTVSSNDENEVISMAKRHAADKHDMDLDDAGAKEMIEEH